MIKLKMESLQWLFSRASIGGARLEPTGCVLYARVSSSCQASIDDQLSACNKYAADRGLPVHSVFKDYGSGRNLHKLQNHSKMCSSVIQASPALLVVYDISRLGRSVEVIKIIDILHSAGVEIYSVFDDLLVTPTDTMSMVRAYKLVASAIEYSELLSQRIKRAYALKKQRNLFTGHKAPYGFKVKLYYREEKIVDPVTLKVKVTRVDKERRLVIDPETYNDAKRLAKTKMDNVKRPKNMTLRQLKLFRLKFRTYNSMVFGENGSMWLQRCTR